MSSGVSLRDSLLAQSEAAWSWKGASQPWGVVGGVAPGDGESLSGAAAPSTNRNVQRRGADQSGMKGRAGLGSTWRLEFSPRAPVGRSCVCSRAPVTTVCWDLDHAGDKGESRAETVASLHVDDPV